MTTLEFQTSGSGTTSLAWTYIKVHRYSDPFCKNLNQRSLTPRWPLTPHLVRSYVWLYPRIIVFKSHENTSKYVDTVTIIAKTWTKGHWPLDDLWPHICWGLMGGTTLNQLPIGLHVEILNFNGRFEAYWATFGMLSWYQSIQNRWKFNICFNVWVVVGIVFAVRERKQHPSCFWPDFKPQTAIPPLRIIRDYFRHRNNILFFCVFKFICSPYIIISYITSRYLLFNSPKRGQNISKKPLFWGTIAQYPTKRRRI